MNDAKEVQACMHRAERLIESALNRMVQEIGPGWMLDVDIGAIDVASLSGPGWIWRARIEAKLASHSEAA